MKEKLSRASKEFKKKIKSYCDEENLPIYNLAAKLGRSQTPLKHILNGSRNFTEDNIFIKELAKLVGYEGSLFEVDEIKGKLK